VGGRAGGKGAEIIGPNLGRMPRKVWMRGDNGYRSFSIVAVKTLRSVEVSSSVRSTCMGIAR
jgi:hypothetical protein